MLLSDFLIIAILLGVKWNLIMVLRFRSLMTNDVKYIFISLWPFVYILCRNVYLDPLPI